MSVFLNQDDPGYFKIRRILWRRWMRSISTQDSAWTSAISAICSTGSNWSCVSHATESHGGLLPIQQLVMALAARTFACFYHD